MKRSTERILTTHAGSLPRPSEVLDLVEGRDQREVSEIPGADGGVDGSGGGGMFSEFDGEFGGGPTRPPLPACDGPITWRGPEFIQRDIATLRAALQGVSPTDVFMPAVSPGQIWLNFANEYYPSDEDYVFPPAAALANEYPPIVPPALLLP